MGYKKLTKSKNHRMISGVLGGIADYLGVDPTVVRVIFLLVAGSGIPIILYIAMALIMPEAE
ncbi:PspC domain-containing protein [Granulicatella seriolae]|uniref:PspC domain-containing protein n=1 Tax=Granulicatella seriolae TaxID=2967226 RepID=A0ABT1WMD6_9LACT|nr:PspC domain-containing protein [Granulicatella seriolae]